MIIENYSLNILEGGVSYGWQRIDTLQNNEMSQKNRNKEKLEKEAKIRCANFMIEMIKKYGAEIGTKSDSSACDGV